MTPDEGATGIVLFGHGSSVEEANQGVRELALQIQNAGPYHYVRAAFLELAQPDLNAAVAESAEAGLRRVIIIPFFLTMGIHLRRDLPNLIAPMKQKYPRLEIQVGQSLEGHPLMASIILGRVREAIEAVEAAR
ncbi:MAG: sirohydrochlorin chelatase [Terriglobia bacterium]